MIGNSLIVAVTPDKHDVIEEIVEENTCTIKEKAWQSKYNRYVIYDYKPLCSEGFILKFEIVGNINKLKFLKVLIEQRLERIQQLKKCYNLVRCDMKYNAFNMFRSCLKKSKFKDYSKAQQRAMKYNQRVYFCPLCGFYHLTKRKDE